LITWAKGCNRLLDYQPPKDSASSSGTEHDVYFHEAEGRVFKKTKDGTFGSIRTEIGTRRAATPFFYLRRLEWCNEVFDSDFRLEWIDPNPPTAIVISQPLAEAEDDAHPTPTEREIIEFMTKMGFQSVKNNPQEWYRESDGCSACDAKCENFIKTAFGIRPIDLIVSKDLGFNPHDL
jgi:hypothetical protein